MKGVRLILGLALVCCAGFAQIWESSPTGVVSGWVRTGPSSAVLRVAGTNVVNVSGPAVQAGTLASTTATFGDGTVTDLFQVARIKAGTAGSLNAFGDSITSGYGTSSNYVTNLAGLFGWNLTNQAVSGNALQDAGFTDHGFTTPVDYSSVCTLLTGVNDMRQSGSDGTYETNYEGNLMALLAHLAVPDAKKQYATNASVVYTGDWATNALYGIATGRQIAGVGTVAANVWGTTAYIVCSRTNSGGGTFSLVVDGTSSGTFSCDGANVDVRARPCSPYLIRIANLAYGKHLLVLTSDGTGLCFVQWFGGNADASLTPGPQVYVGNCLRLTTAGYAAGSPDSNKGSDSVVAEYNRIIDRCAKTLASDGLNVTLVDAGAHYDPATMCQSDGIHPNSTGQTALTESFTAMMNGLRPNGPSQAGSSLGTGGFPTALGVRPNVLTFDSVNARIGVGKPDQTVDLGVRKSVTGGVTSVTENDSDGTGNYARDIVTAGGVNGYFITLPPSYTSSGQHVASGSTLQNDGIGGLSVGAINALGSLRFYSGGTSARGNFDTNGWLHVGASCLTVDTTNDRIGIGSGGTTPAYDFYLSKSVAGAVKHAVYNTSTSSSAYVQYIAAASTANGTFTALSHGWTTSYQHYQDGVTLGADGVGGLSIATTHDSADIRFFTHDSSEKERARLLANGNFGIGTNAAPALLTVGVAGGGIQLASNGTITAPGTIQGAGYLSAGGTAGKSVTNTWYSVNSGLTATVTNVTVVLNGLMTSWTVGGVETMVTP